MYHTCVILIVVHVVLWHIIIYHKFDIVSVVYHIILRRACLFFSCRTAVVVHLFGSLLGVRRLKAKPYAGIRNIAALALNVCDSCAIYLPRRAADSLQHLHAGVLVEGFAVVLVDDVL